MSDASHIATVPSAQIKWYLIFHETSCSEDLKKEIDTSGDEAGRDVQEVRGYDPAAFRESVYAGGFLYGRRGERTKALPLHVTNRGLLGRCRMRSVAEWLMVFSLAEIDNGPRSPAIASF